MAKLTKPKDAKALAVFCAKMAIDKQASNPVLLDIAPIDGSPAEWFVIATCHSEPQLRAVAEHIEVSAKKAGVDIPRSEGWDSNWIILDFFDVVVHIMHEDAREFYKLEKLWGDAEMFTISDAGRTVKYKAEKKKVNRLDEE